MIVETKSGKQLTIVGTHDTEVIKRTYNFEVEDFHTYYVGDEEILVHNMCKPKSPDINPKDIAGKTPSEIDKIATDSGLIRQGPDAKGGRGSFDDPVTGNQRVLVHPNADCPHCHVNNPAGERLDIDGNVVGRESPEAHLPLGED